MYAQINRIKYVHQILKVQLAITNFHIELLLKRIGSSDWRYPSWYSIRNDW